jgi:dTDP-4-amino-4,6-dideoxygalactose transaminase
MQSGKKMKPALEGGSPVREGFLSFHKPSIDESDLGSVAKVLESGWLTLGPETTAFEEGLRGYLGAEHVIAVSSCSEAMFLTLKAIELSPGDEVITSPLTFASTVQAIIHCGAVPVLVDVEEDTFGIDPSLAAERVGPRTKAVLPVHFGGQACRIKDIISMAREKNLFVLEDAAHSFGGEVEGKKIGTLGDATAFSFYATKNITTGEGGCVATNDDALAERIRKLGFHGISRDAWSRYADKGSWYYEVDLAGYKSNMSDMMAALGNSQLAKADRLRARRASIAEEYTKRLGGLPWLELPGVLEGNLHTWHLYVIRLRLDMLRVDRDRFIAALASENIGSSVHFIPVYKHPFFEPYAREGESFPRCEDFFARCISLPIYPAMTDRDVKDVVEALEKLGEWYAG